TGANTIAGILRSIAGAEDVQVKAPAGAPAISIRLDPERAAELGFRPVDVLEAIQIAYQGSIVAQAFRASQIMDIVVLLDAEARNDPNQIGSLLLRNALGTFWRLD